MYEEFTALDRSCTSLACYALDVQDGSRVVNFCTSLHLIQQIILLAHNYTVFHNVTQSLVLYIIICNGSHVLFILVEHSRD